MCIAQRLIAILRSLIHENNDILVIFYSLYCEKYCVRMDFLPPCVTSPMLSSLRMLAENCVLISLHVFFPSQVKAFPTVSLKVRSV